MTETALGLKTQRILQAELDAGKGISEFTMKDFVDYYLSQIGYSANGFTFAKRDLIAYLESIGAEQAIAEFGKIRQSDLTHHVMFRDKYFKSFDVLLDSLEARVAILSKFVDPGVFDTSVACLILAWAGVDIGNSVNVKKHGADKENSLVVVCDKAYRIPERGMAFLDAYRRSDGYVKATSKGLGFMAYKPSEYLLRNYKSDQMSVLNLHRKLTVDLNIEGKSPQFFYPSVQMSGVFFRVHAWEKNNYTLAKPQRSAGDVDRNAVFSLLCERFETKFSSLSRAYQRLDLYEAYKRYFFS